MSLEEQARTQKLGEIRRHHADRSPVGEFCETCFVLVELDTALGARRRISKSELETMAKAIRSAASRGGVSWKDYSEGYRELAIDEAKAACTSVGFEVEE